MTSEKDSFKENDKFLKGLIANLEKDIENFKQITNKMLIRKHEELQLLKDLLTQENQKDYFITIPGGDDIVCSRCGEMNCKSIVCGEAPKMKRKHALKKLNELVCSECGGKRPCESMYCEGSPTIKRRQYYSELKKIHGK